MGGAEGKRRRPIRFSWPPMPLAGLQKVLQEMAVGLPARHRRGLRRGGRALSESTYRCIVRGHLVSEEPPSPGGRD